MASLYVEHRPRSAQLLAGTPMPEEVREAVRRTTPNPLTKRHTEILQLVACGTSNKEIGYLLNIVPHTVKTHMTTIMRELQANDRAHAAVIALQHGWIDFPEM